MIFRPAVWEMRYRPPGDPLTIMAGVSLAMTVVGTISSASAQSQQGQTAQAMANYNAMGMQARASQVDAEARVRAEMQGRENSRKLGQMRAAYGAAGVDVEGTPLDVLNDAATEGELQKSLIIYRGQTEAESLRTQAALVRAGGAATNDAAQTAAGTTLLTGLAQAGMGAYSMYGGSGMGNPRPPGGQSPAGAWGTPHGAVRY